MKKLLCIAFMLASSVLASADVECEREFLHVYWTTPNVPCVSAEGGCTKQTAYVSNYCGQDLLVNPDLKESFVIPPGGTRKQIVLGGIDPTECIEACVFFNESLEWERDDACALGCSDSINNYSVGMRLGDVDFVLSGSIIEHETYTSPLKRRMTLFMQYVVPVVLVLFLALQWQVYKTDKFVFDDYGLRNLAVIAASALAYAVLLYGL